MGEKVDITVTLKLRPATYYDLVDNANKYRFGTMYFLRSGVTGQFDPQPYYITQDTDKIELNRYFKNNQLFVAICHFDDTEVTITPIEQQQHA
jgi:hypothetical protein